MAHCFFIVDVRRYDIKNLSEVKVKEMRGF